MNETQQIHQSSNAKGRSSQLSIYTTVQIPIQRKNTHTDDQTPAQLFQRLSEDLGRCKMVKRKSTFFSQHNKIKSGDKSQKMNLRTKSQSKMKPLQPIQLPKKQQINCPDSEAHSLKWDVLKRKNMGEQKITKRVDGRKSEEPENLAGKKRKTEFKLFGSLFKNKYLHEMLDIEQRQLNYMLGHAQSSQKKIHAPKQPTFSFPGSIRSNNPFRICSQPKPILTQRSMPKLPKKSIVLNRLTPWEQQEKQRQFFDELPLIYAHI